MHPLWWVSSFEGDELQRNWEMDQVKVQVFNTKVFEGLLTSHLDMFLSMECVPQLAGDPEILSGYQAFINGFLDSLTALFLIAVVTCLVNAPVSRFDGTVDGVSHLFLWDFPAAEAD